MTATTADQKTRLMFSRDESIEPENVIYDYQGDVWQEVKTVNDEEMIQEAFFPPRLARQIAIENLYSSTFGLTISEVEVYGYDFGNMYYF